MRSTVFERVERLNFEIDLNVHDYPFCVIDNEEVIDYGSKSSEFYSFQ